MDAGSGAKDHKCTRCGDALPATFFSRGMKWCRTCVSEYNRRRRAFLPRHEPAAEKGCAHCHQLLPASEYTLYPLHRTGLQPWCKRCERERMRKVQAANSAAPLPAAALAPTKTCTTCGRRQLRAAFHQVPKNWDGLHYKCKACYSNHRRKGDAQQRLQSPPSAAPLQQHGMPDPSD